MYCTNSFLHRIWTSLLLYCVRFSCFYVMLCCYALVKDNGGNELVCTLQICGWNRRLILSTRPDNDVEASKNENRKKNTKNYTNYRLARQWYTTQCSHPDVRRLGTSKQTGKRKLHGGKHPLQTATFNRLINAVSVLALCRETTLSSSVITAQCHPG